MTALRGDGRGLPRRIRLILFAAAAALLLILFHQALGQLLWQIALAVLLAYAARPICARFERRLPPGAAALCSLLLFLAVLGGFLWLLVPQVIHQGTLAVEAVPMLIDILQAFLEKLAASPLFERFNLSPAPTQQLLEKAGAAVLAIVPKVLQRIASASGKLMQAFLAPVLAFYFLRDRELFCFQLSLLIPLQQRKKLLTALREMRREIAGYLRGQLLVSSAVGILTAIGLLIVGVPAWLLLGIVMGVCDLIPYVGPYLGGIPIVLFSLPQGLYTVLWAVVAVVAVQQAESMFLSPQLMSGVTGAASRLCAAAAERGRTAGRHRRDAAVASSICVRARRRPRPAMRGPRKRAIVFWLLAAFALLPISDAQGIILNERRYRHDKPE